MEKEFIPYNEALALKELEFYEPCLGAYMSGGLRIFQFENNLKGYVNDNNIIIGAPTFSQAFRWFRVKYDLRVYFPSTSPYCFDYIIVTSNRRFKDFAFDNLKKFTSPEEAELACVKKLIEIVKSK